MKEFTTDSDPAYRDPSPEERDAEHLRVLSIFHYVLGAMTFLVASLFLVYLLVGVMSIGELSPRERAGLPADLRLGFTRSGIIGLSIGWSIAGINALSGWCMARRRFRGFSLFTGAVNCLWPPVGTCLGIVTIIVLLRASVLRLYHHRVVP